MNKNNKGFTLLELICAVAIMAVLTGMVLPAAGRYIQKARETRERMFASELWQGMQLYMMDYHPTEYIPGYQLMEEVSVNPADSTDSPLRGYLPASGTDGFTFSNIAVSRSTLQITLIAYRTKRFDVQIENGNISLKPH